MSRDLFAFAEADAVFVGATRYRGPGRWLALAPRWRAMTAQMRRLPGYRAHRVYYTRPFVLGAIGAFATRDDLLRFARTGEHRALMEWVTDGTRNATGGYIRLFEAVDPPVDPDPGSEPADPGAAADPEETT